MESAVESRNEHVQSYGAIEGPERIGEAFDAQTTADGAFAPPSRNVPLVWRALCSAGIMFTLLASLVFSRSSTGLRSEQASLYNVKSTAGKAGNSGSRPHADHALSEGTPSVMALKLRATNEYGEFDRSALALYRLEMLVEPYRETTLTASGSGSSGIFHWRIMEADTSGEPLSNAIPVVEARGNHEIEVTLTNPGGVYLLTVDERRPDGSLIAQGKIKVSCKHVRREMRDLKDAEREEYLQAMEQVYRVSTKEGKAKYGDSFVGYEHITSYHNSNNYCYHNGLQFLPAHISFDRVMERSIQSVNPKVAMPLWDYMIDSAVYGYDWHESPMFADEMFGRTTGSPANDFQLQTGRFANITSVFDPDNALAGDGIDPLHSPFGYVGAEYDYKDSYFMARTTSLCGMAPRGTLPVASDFTHCFYKSGTLVGWEACMETTIHASIHAHFNGAFYCNVDMAQFAKEHPEFDRTLLTFVLMSSTSLYWPYNGYMSDYNECDTKCTRGQSEPCGCTCKIDVWSLTDDEVYDMGEAYLTMASSIVNGDLYTNYDETSDYPYAFQQNGVRTTNEQTVTLLRPLLSILCEPGAIGTIITNSSPMDPAFWLFHPLFERALHVLLMSPKFLDNYTFDWSDGSCDGSRYEDELPFNEKVLGFGEGTDYLTNKELMAVFHPSNPRLPYVYEKFSQWGTITDWDFCPECVEAAAMSESKVQ